MKKFNMKKAVEDINTYYMSDEFAKRLEWRESVSHQKDFYNSANGNFHCGKCGKIMSPIRSMFHFLHSK